MTDLQVAEDLEAAAEALDRFGWRQGGRVQQWPPDPNPPGCLVEMVSYGVSANTAGWHTPLRHNRRVNAAQEALMKHLGLKYPWKLISWNDHRDRTEGEVRDALLETAKEIRNG